MDNEALITLFQDVGRLKDIKRAGWERVSIPEPESIADHSFRCVFMALVLSEVFNVDSDKLLKMAILHDIAECITGDITPHDGLSKEEKYEMEKQGIIKLFENIPNAPTYLDLWMEYEEQDGIEARLVKSLDKFEMALSAIEYQDKYPDLDLAEFIDEAGKQIVEPEIFKLYVHLKTQVRAISQ